MKFGDVVTYTQEALDYGIPTKKHFKNGLIGICVNVSEDEHFVSVLWKGNSTSSQYAKTFIKLRGD